MKNRRNFYRILQVQPDAPVDIIRNNYRTLLQKLRLHPDLGGDHRDAAQINQAYYTLRDPQRRAAYDRRLLQDYHIQVLSQGRLASEVCMPTGKTKTVDAGKSNRRNYYRILHIQTDAPAAIIAASYQMQMKNPQAPINLVQEAFAVLSDPQKRQTYDRLIKVRSHSEAVDRKPAVPCNPWAGGKRIVKPEPSVHPPPARSVPYKPLITQFCHFCKTPHAHSSMGDHTELCTECASPLFAIPRESGIHGGRRLSRMARHGDMKYYLDWPGREYAGILTDLSPDGLRFTTSTRLCPQQVIKIESEHLRCVARVMHRQSSTAGESVGSRFITILFNQQQGNFVSALA